jgi:catechol 2,3-dioxygenase-like lactoylglutathione lyase family enzyme
MITRRCQLTLAAFAVFGLAVSNQHLLGADWDHVHLTATDTAAAAAWYAKHFGSEPIKAGQFDAIVYGKTVVKFKGGIPNFKGSAGSAVDHIGFSVPDARAKMKELEQAGVKVVAPARYAERGDFYYGFVEDPWGTKIEVLGDPELLGFHHVHLRARKQDAAAKWYSDTFSGMVSHFKGLNNLPGIRYGDMWVLVSETQEELAPTHDRSIDHIGWKVPDLDRLAEKLKAQSTRFLVEPRQSGNVKLAFIEGPDGVKIEIQQVLDN